MVKRNFRENPVTDAEIEQCIWYVNQEDLIGGWIITTVDKPASQINPYDGEFELANFVKKSMAEHIVELHNQWWTSVVWASYQNNIALSTWMDSYDEIDFPEEYRSAQEIRDFYPDGKAPLPEGVVPMTEDEWFDYND